MPLVYACVIYILLVKYMLCSLYLYLHLHDVCKACVFSILSYLNVHVYAIVA